ncbi:CRTAC1 family protein [uncultured Lamprocystis sp.]|jgi:hypothetical protein|uniref:CRTAC1 family protein n=1 Tax=uncultured Lamprocystis sp. TaxID=543132 RepID=UPI0025E6C181|nr:CRTAC1 family protein [uncultured Lamprocystis sp.]
MAKPGNLTASLIAIGFFASSPVLGFVEFEDVTPGSGVANFSKSWGACWGDINNDGWLDLYANNHQETHTLYINQQDGTFLNHPELLGFDGPIPNNDAHGCAWGDLDGDGDQDMIELSGGNGGREVWPGMANRLYINDHGALSDKAHDYQMAVPEGRSRTPLLFDYNNDGLLDVVLTTLSQDDGLAPSTLMRNELTSFSDVGAQVGFNLQTSTPFAQLADLSQDDKLDLIAWRMNPEKWMVHDIGQTPFDDISSSVLSRPLLTGDAAIADFDGDLRQDIYLAYYMAAQSEVVVANGKELRSSMVTSGSAKYMSTTFTTDGVITADLVAPWFKVGDINIGSGSLHPTSQKLSLDPEDAQNHGRPVFTEGVSRGVYLWFDPNQKTWSLAISSPNPLQGAADSVFALFKSLSNIRLGAVVGVKLDAPFPPDLVHLGDPEGLSEVRSATWLSGVPACSSQGVVAGDFDNDMDVDLYVVCSWQTSNYPDVFLENVGTRFVPVFDAFPGQAIQDGVGDNAVVADFDNDGFLDLYVMNGAGAMPFAHGTHQLVRNKGNKNHWLEVDLVGVNSNRDGVGATVYVTAGGVTQVREQGGGIHRNVQDTHRLHFGLAGNETIQEVKVVWPSGIEQFITDVGADKVVKLYEPVHPVVIGQPALRPFRTAGILVGRDTVDSPYRLAVIGDNDESLYEILVVSTSTLNIVAAPSIDPQSGEMIATWPKGFRAVLKSGQRVKEILVSAPVDAALILAVNKDGRPNLNSVVIGGASDEAVPLGWIKAVDSYPAMPVVDLGRQSGVYAGIGDDRVSMRWTAASQQQISNAVLFSSEEKVVVDRYGIQPQDHIVSYDNGVVYGGSTDAGRWAGLDVHPQERNSLVAIINLLNTERGRSINSSDRSAFGAPNATLLNSFSPYEKPVLERGIDDGLFVWKDTDGRWVLRAQSSAGTKTFKGKLTSDQPLAVASTRSIEAPDKLIANPDGSISFELTVTAPWEDEFVISVARGATVMLDVTPTAPGLAVKIGKEKYRPESGVVWLGGSAPKFVFDY